MCIRDRDADISAAAPPALHQIPLLGCEAGGQHIIDLAGHAAQFFRQFVALQIGAAVLRLLQYTINISGDFVG